MMQGTGAGADMGGDGFADNNNNNNNNNNKGQRDYESEGECNGWVGAREHRLEREGSRASIEADHGAPRRRETEAEGMRAKSAESVDSMRTSHNTREAMTGPREEVRGPLHGRGSAHESAGWILAPPRPSRGDTTDSMTESEKMRHEDWVDNVWAFSASKQDEDYGIDHEEEELSDYGYRSREERAATAGLRQSPAGPRLHSL